MKKLIYFCFFILFNFILVSSCSDLLDLGDPGNRDDPLSQLSFANLQDLANQSIKLGYVPIYSTFGGGDGLISLGDANGCVVMTYGKLKCWGQDDNSQLGDGLTSNNSAPHLATSVNPTSTSDMIVAVVLGRTSSCAFFYSGYKCWGNQASGVLGNGVSSSYATTAQTVTNAPGLVVKIIQLNDGYSCVMSTSGVINCWGANANGQLGNGTTTASLTGVNVSLNGTASSFIAHNNDSCAILTSNIVKCWGQDYGSTPVQVTLSGTPQYLGSGTSNSPFLGCVVLTNGNAQCFGTTQNAFGQLGNGTTTAPANAVTGYTVISAYTNQPLVGVSMIGTGGAFANTTVNFACAVADDYTNVYCWGKNTNGNLGNGSSSDSNKATLVRKTWPNSNIVDLAVADGRACILLRNNDVWCWGGNAYGFGELGTGSGLTNTSSIPIKILNRADP